MARDSEVLGSVPATSKKKPYLIVWCNRTLGKDKFECKALALLSMGRNIISINGVQQHLHSPYDGYGIRELRECVLL